jgi:hypothetical protein
MSGSLIIRPTTISGKPQIRWALQLRYHDMAETNYYTIARISDEVASEIIAAGAAYYLFKEPEPSDWKTQLEQLAPDDMTKEQLFMEVVRLRKELMTKEQLFMEVVRLRKELAIELANRL